MISLSVLTYSIYKKFIKKRKVINGKYLTPKKFCIKTKIIIITFGMILDMFLKWFFPNESVNQKRIEASQKGMDIFTALIDSSISPAIIEEICFRGILFIIILGSSSYFFNLTEHRNDWIGLTVFFIFSSLFFGFAHVVQGYDIQNAGGYIVSGVVFSFTFLLTRDLKLPVIIHGLNNAFSILYRYDLQYVNIIILYSLLFLSICFLIMQLNKIQDYGSYLEYKMKKKFHEYSLRRNLDKY